nr:unnamed protein product [Callosobruchus chinensis]
MKSREGQFDSWVNRPQLATTSCFLTGARRTVRDLPLL